MLCLLWFVHTKHECDNQTKNNPCVPTRSNFSTKKIQYGVKCMFNTIDMLYWILFPHKAARRKDRIAALCRAL